MSHDQSDPAGPDLGAGVPMDEIPVDGPLFGHVEGNPVMILGAGDELRALSAKCTHYGAPLSDGLVRDGTVRCPWHHACFSLEDGTVRGGPAFNPLPRYQVRLEDGVVFVGAKEERDPLAAERPRTAQPSAVVIVGAGPAGTTAAETLRREGYAGPVSLVDPDPDAPYDRPNLSKDYLAGDAPEAWLPLRSRDFFRDHGIDRIEARVTSIDPDARRVTLDSGGDLEYGALLLAAGAVPRTLDGEGMSLPHVRTLRSLADCRDIIEAAESARAVVVVGASFIGMEAAASLRARGLDVAVVAPESIPFEATLGEEIGTFIRSLHDDAGVTFHLGRTVREVRAGSVLLDDDTEVAGDLVVVGVGVRPDTTLAQEAGLEVEDGIVVDGTLRTSVPNIFAAGDVACYPNPRSGRRVRIEHWVVAGRQGRTAARNILGREETFTDVPFFWTSHFGRSVSHVGHAEEWERVERDGSCADDGCSVGYWQHGRRLALATVRRDMESLQAEAAMEAEASGPRIEADWGV